MRAGTKAFNGHRYQPPQSFVQDNHSRRPACCAACTTSCRRIRRAKLVRVAGAAFDVAVDIRRGLAHLSAAGWAPSSAPPTTASCGFPGVSRMVSSLEDDSALPLQDHRRLRAGLRAQPLPGTTRRLAIVWPLPGGLAPKLSANRRWQPARSETSVVCLSCRPPTCRSGFAANMPFAAEPCSYKRGAPRIFCTALYSARTKARIAGSDENTGFAPPAVPEGQGSRKNCCKTRLIAAHASG